MPLGRSNRDHDRRETPLCRQQGPHQWTVSQRSELLRPLQGDPPPVFDRGSFRAQLCLEVPHLCIAGASIG
jgi:hypothetical protein